MNKRIALLICLAVFAAVTLNPAEAQGYQFQTTRTPAEGFAKAGEKIVFTATLLEKGKPAALPIKTFLQVEGSASTTKEGIGEMTVEATAPESGFTNFSASFTAEGAKKSLKSYDSVATEPETIRQGMPEPADFDSFWEKAKAELAAVPMKTTIKQVAVTDEEYKEKVSSSSRRWKGHADGAIAT